MPTLNSIHQSIRRPPPLIPRLNKEKEIEFSITPSDTEDFFHQFEEDHDMPAGRRKLHLPQGERKKSIGTRIDDIRRIIFLIATEPRSGILPFLQYSTLICLILLANLIMILQTGPKFQYTPSECMYCNNSDELDRFNIESELAVNKTNATDLVIGKILDIPCVCPPTPYPILTTIEAYCTYYFTVEWLLRILCYVPTPSQLSKKIEDSRTHNYHSSYFKLWASYLFRASTIIDFIAIFSFYLLEYLPKFKGLYALRLLRVLRLFQLVRIGAYSSIFISLGNVLRKAMMCIAMLCIVLVFGAVFFGSMIFFFEKGTWQFTTETDPPSYQYMRLSVDGLNYEISPYKSIIGSFWWFIVTATTVGYGDYYPTSTGGKVVAVFAMLMGLLVVAFPVSVFSDLWSKELRDRGLLKNAMKECDKEDEIYKGISSYDLTKQLQDESNNKKQLGNNDDEVLHNLMQEFNKQNNDTSKIAFNQSDINSLYYYWTMVQNSQNEIRNIMIRNLLNQRGSDDDENQDMDFAEQIKK